MCRTGVGAGGSAGADKRPDRRQSNHEWTDNQAGRRRQANTDSDILTTQLEQRLAGPHTHIPSRHMHWHCQSSTVTQTCTLLPRDVQPSPAPAATSRTAAALPSAQVHPWKWVPADVAPPPCKADHAMVCEKVAKMTQMRNDNLANALRLVVSTFTC